MQVGAPPGMQATLPEGTPSRNPKATPQSVLSTGPLAGPFDGEQLEHTDPAFTFRVYQKAAKAGAADLPPLSRLFQPRLAGRVGPERGWPSWSPSGGKSSPAAAVGAPVGGRISRQAWHV
jgi:hypothetical protein